jgi:hypothetical protein
VTVEHAGQDLKDTAAETTSSPLPIPAPTPSSRPTVQKESEQNSVDKPVGKEVASAVGAAAEKLEPVKLLPEVEEDPLVKAERQLYNLVLAYKRDVPRCFTFSFVNV